MEEEKKTPQATDQKGLATLSAGGEGKEMEGNMAAVCNFCLTLLNSQLLFVLQSLAAISSSDSKEKAKLLAEEKKYSFP